jgi:hypothetical protein
MEAVWQFIAVAGTAASLAGAILAWQTRDPKQRLDRMDQRHLAHQAQTQAMFARLDRAAEQRAEAGQEPQQLVLTRSDSLRR